MDINKELDKLIFQYGIDRPFPNYRKIIEERGYVIYPSDDVINEGQFLLKYEKGDFFDLSHPIYLERQKLKQAKNAEDAVESLQRLVFMFVYIRDFVNARRMLDLYMQNQYCNYERYQGFSKELENFFHNISVELADNKTLADGAIINYWLDDLDHGWEQKMPYLNEVSSKCVHFENAYTFTNYTTYTLKNILLAKETIDDKVYDVDKAGRDCKLIQTLQKRGWDFCYYGFHSYSLEESCCSETKFGRDQPSALVLWEALKDMLLTGQKKMYMLHLFAETHIPWLTPVTEGEYYSSETIRDFKTIDTDSKDALEKRMQARLYLDGQLRFYDTLFGDRMSKIYMSDHGDGIDGYEFFSDSHHIILMARDSHQLPGKITSYFSHVDYYKLIEHILDHKQITDQIGGLYAKIQGIHYCHRFTISKCLNKERFSPDFLLGFRGVVRDEDNYILRADGYERYRRKGDRINYIDFSEYSDQIEELRRIAGNQFPDVYESGIFQYSRAIEKVIERYKKRVGKEEIGISMIKEYVDAIPEGKCIAIRGGGEHTMMMLSVLADRCRRISYIADRNTQIAPPLGIPVISPEELKEIKPDVVLISSLKLHKEFADEIARFGMDCDIYDIYGELEKKGIYLDCGFYENRYLEEDFEGITV